MKRAIGAAALMAVVCTVAWAQQATSPREELKRVQAAPDVAGRSLDDHIVMTPQDLKWVDAPPVLPRGTKVATIEGDPKVPDRLFTLRLRLPKGAVIPPHFHGTDEHVTVISGEFQIGMGETFNEKELHPVRAGGFVALPAGHVHYARARGDTEIQLHGAGPWTLTYINPKDDPSRGVGGSGARGGPGAGEESRKGR